MLPLAHLASSQCIVYPYFLTVFIVFCKPLAFLAQKAHGRRCAVRRLVVDVTDVSNKKDVALVCAPA